MLCDFALFFGGILGTESGWESIYGLESMDGAWGTRGIEGSLGSDDSDVPSSLFRLGIADGISRSSSRGRLKLPL
jgi:hypothetical protein